jgi:hypothetical protein
MTYDQWIERHGRFALRRLLTKLVDCHFKRGSNAEWSKLTVEMHAIIRDLESVQ